MVGGGEAPRGDENKSRKELSPADADRAWMESGAEVQTQKMLPIELDRIKVRRSARDREIKGLVEKADKLKADISIGENTEENQAQLTEIAQQLGAHADDAFQDWERVDAIVLANRRDDSQNLEPGYERWNDRLQSREYSAWIHTQQAFDYWTAVLNKIDPARADAIRRNLDDRRRSAWERNERNPLPQPPSPEIAKREDDKKIPQGRDVKWETTGIGGIDLIE